MGRDSVEDLLIARAEDDVRADAGCGLGNAPGDELGVPLAAAFRLGAGHVPRAVMQRGWPMRVRVALRTGTGANREPPGRMLIASVVGDDGGAVTVRQQHHVSRTPCGGRGHFRQMGQWPCPHRVRGRARWQPPREQDRPLRRDHHPGAASGRISGARGQRLGGTLAGAELDSFAAGIGPGHVPGLLPFGRRVRHLDRSRHHRVGHCRARLEGPQCRIQLQAAELEQRMRERCVWHAPITPDTRPAGNTDISRQLPAGNAYACSGGVAACPVAVGPAEPAPCCWTKSLLRMAARETTPDTSAMIAATSRMRFRPVVKAVRVMYCYGLPGGGRVAC